MRATSYTMKELRAEATNALRNYRKAHHDRIKKYVFADVPFFLFISKENPAAGDLIVLKVQIKNRENGWTESISISL